MNGRSSTTILLCYYTAMLLYTTLLFLLSAFLHSAHHVSPRLSAPRLSAPHFTGELKCCPHMYGLNGTGGYSIGIKCSKPFVVLCKQAPCLLRMSHSLTHCIWRGCPAEVGLHGECFLAFGFELQPVDLFPPSLCAESVPSYPTRA